MTDEGKKADKELDEFLKGTSELSSLYRDASNEVVPAHLDDAVLRLAREDVDQSNRTVLSPFSGNWKVPASLAAVLVLSVTVILKMENSGPLTVENEIASPALSNTPQHDTESTLNEIDAKSPENEVDTMSLPVIDREIDEAGYPASDVLEMSDFVGEAVDSTAAEEAISTAKTLKSTAAGEISITSEPGEQLAPDSKNDFSSPARASYQEKAESSMVEADKAKMALPAASARRDRILRRELPPQDDEETGMVFERAIASPSYAQARNPVDWLRDIRSLWLDDQKEQARREFTELQQQYPDISKEVLLETLGRDVLSAIESQLQQD